MSMKSTLFPGKPEEVPVRLPRNTELTIDPHVAQWAIRVITRIFAIYAVVVGCAIVVGGAPRFAGVSYRVALSIPGAPATWGVVIAVAGLVALTGSLVGKPTLTGVGMAAAAIWSLLFASAFALTAWQYPEANTTAVWIYLSMSFVLFLLAAVHLAMRIGPNRK